MVFPPKPYRKKKNKTTSRKSVRKTIIPGNCFDNGFCPWKKGFPKKLPKKCLPKKKRPGVFQKFFGKVDSLGARKMKRRKLRAFPPNLIMGGCKMGGKGKEKAPGPQSHPKWAKKKNEKKNRFQNFSNFFLVRKKFPRVKNSTPKTQELKTGKKKKGLESMGGAWPKKNGNCRPYLTSKMKLPHPPCQLPVIVLFVNFLKNVLSAPLMRKGKALFKKWPVKIQQTERPGNNF